VILLTTLKIEDKIRLLLAEKRTSLSMLRTAIAIFTLPLSVFTVLVATSSYYDPVTILYFLIPLVGFVLFLSFLGIYMVFRSFKKIRLIDHKIEECKKDKEFSDLKEIL
jgi:uncharacterized membrane protein YidH (DUF202 family)